MANLGTNGGNAAGSDDALALSGSDSNIIAKNGVAAGEDLVLGGVNLGGANSGSITINGAAGVQEVAEQFTETLNSLTGKTEETTAKSEEARAAESASWRKMVLYIAAGLGLLLLGILIRKK